jgi:lysophospholipase L1-like esterase
MKIFFFGDSICFGQFISPHKTWVSRIAQRLERLPGGECITVMNPSISGNTTRMALERMPFDVQEHGVDIALIQYGINDSNLWETDKGLPRVSQQAFEANLLEIITRFRTFGARKVFLNTNHPTSKMISLGETQIPHQKGNQEYNTIIRQIAENDSEIQLIDIEQEFLTRIEGGRSLNEYLLVDGIHLSAQGHLLYEQIVYPFIKTVVLSELHNL